MLSACVLASSPIPRIALNRDVPRTSRRKEIGGTHGHSWSSERGYATAVSRSKSPAIEKQASRRRSHQTPTWETSARSTAGTCGAPRDGGMSQWSGACGTKRTVPHPVGPAYGPGQSQARGGGCQR